MPDGADTTRDAVAAAFKEVASRAEPAPAPDPAPEPSPAPSTPAEPSGDAEARAEAKAAEDRARDGKGRFIVPKKPAAPEKAPASTTSTGQGGAVAPLAPVLAAAPPAPALEALKPPQDWRAQAKEKWAGLPREVQEEALRLHVETKKALQSRAELEKNWQGYQQTVAPFEMLLRTNGFSDPTQAVGALLQREAILHHGTLEQKVQLLANGIKAYVGTDDRTIDLLAKHLSGEAQQQPAAPQQIDPRQIVAQARQEMRQEMEQRATEWYQQNAESELGAFRESHEFLQNDEPDPETGLTVAEDMANLTDAARRNGKDLSFDDAYKLAIKRHSVVSKVMGQREAAKAATAKAATTQAARAASSSLKSEPAGPSNGKTKDIRETVAEAYYAQKNAR